jgi:hypothetical protein
MARYDLTPEYQRQSDIWSEDKKQLFIDSLINGYDVPKLYFHKLSPKDRTSPSFAIVDGKQRLEAVRGFLGNAFPLSDDFVDVLADKNADAAAGKTYRQLTEQHPALAGRLAQYALDVVVIETADDEVIEELFSRLNEAVPLNAPEKRNAFGGAMPPIIRRLVAKHDFFTTRLPIENRRYKHYDLATKFLFLEDKKAFVSVKKRELDEFVRSFRDVSSRRVSEARAIAKGVEEVLDRMAGVFIEQDELLASVGLVTVYFFAFQKATTEAKLAAQLTRDRLLAFDQLRQHNRLVMRQEQQAIAGGRRLSATRVRQDFAIFDRLMQSPNDGQAIEYRYRILRAFLAGREFKESLPTDLRRKMGG